MTRVPVAALLLVALALAGVAVALPLLAAFAEPGTATEPGAGGAAA